MPQLRSLIVLVAASALAVIGCELVHPPQAAAEGGRVTIGRISVDTVLLPAPTEDTSVFFSVKGSFTPNDKDEEGWVQFVWDFGDGKPIVRSEMYAGSSVQTDQVEHVFTEPGEYEVACTAGHGFGFPSGFRFYKSTKTTVKVVCAGLDAGPKRCPKGKFDPFSGVWRIAQGSTISGDVTVVGDGEDALVTVRYQGKRESLSLLFSGSFKYVPNALGLGPVLIFSGKGKHQIEGGGRSKIVMLQPVGFDRDLQPDEEDTTEEAYRNLVVGFDDLPGIAATAGVATDVGTMLAKLVSRDTATSTTLCTTLAAGVKSVAPNGVVAFATTIGSQGPACLPGHRIVVRIDVEGGKISRNQVDSERMVSHDFALAGETVFFTTAHLGAGDPKENPYAVAGVAVTADAGATAVICRVTVLDAGAAADPFATVTLPPVRLLCIPVVQPLKR